MKLKVMKLSPKPFGVAAVVVFTAAVLIMSAFTA
jgi:hypothetical protein